MLENLKEIFPSLTAYDQQLDENYEWFMTKDDVVFGIHHQELGETNKQLLSTFLRPYEVNLPLQSPTEKLWQSRIEGDNMTAPAHSFRFIYFELPKNQMTAVAFSEAFHTLFDEDYPILWEDDATGVLIEEILQTKEAIHFEQIIDILMNDLSVNVRFFIGPLEQNEKSVPRTFEHVKSLGKQILSVTNQHVMHYTEAFPYLLLQKLTELERKEMGASILTPFDEDDEMLETLQHYFYHNMNISETAKNMYMHRNSIQYRIDKFMKETNINIQSFDEAVTVKLAMLAQSF